MWSALWGLSAPTTKAAASGLFWQLHYFGAAVETTQPNLEALRYWASGLEPVYLEGALERAIAGRRSDSATSSR